MHEALMEQVVNGENARVAWRAVVRNDGAPGIDGMTTKQLRDHVRAHWDCIRAKLLAGIYVPSPVRRKEIEKTGGGIRLLGIPTVLDRWIQQMLLQVLQPIFDPTFSEHSYGFRPGRSAHDAVRAAQTHVGAGKDWLVDMDITKFFDHVNHDILMHRIGQTIRDKRVLRLIGRYLRAGVMIEGVVQATEVPAREQSAFLRRRIGRLAGVWRVRHRVQEPVLSRGLGGENFRPLAQSRSRRR